MKQGKVLILVFALFLSHFTLSWAGPTGAFIWGNKATLNMETSASSTGATTQTMSSQAIKDKVKNIPGVKDVEIDESTNEMTITCENVCTDAIIEKVQKEMEKEGIKLTKKDKPLTP